MLLPSTSAVAFTALQYDYLLLGGGTAGLTLAARLSNSLPHARIGVLEAGLSELSNPLISTPGLFGAVLGTSADWGYKSVPQPFVASRKLDIQRGKMLGGSSGLNFLIWDVGSKDEYDAWGYGWGFDGISKGWKSSEIVHAPTNPALEQILPRPPVDENMHGHKGPLSTSFNQWFPHVSTTFHAAFEKLGVRVNPDPTGGDNLGFSYSLNTIDPTRAERSYSASAFFAPNQDRENLVVLTGVTASKVLFGEDKVTIGVEFVDGEGKTHQAFLKSGDENAEVILTAGAVGSPQLLELSGIGKKSVLDAAGIEVLVENDDVGENLQDHLFATLTYELSPENNVTRDTFFTNPDFAATAQKEYSTNRSGLLTSTSVLPVAMLPLSEFFEPAELEKLIAETESEVDPFEMFALPRSSAEKDNRNAQVEILAVGENFGLVPEPGKTYVTLLSIILHPLSRGSIHITSSNPLDAPTIDPRYYSHPLDRTVMKTAYKWLDKLAEQEPVKSQLRARVDPVPNNDEEFWAHVQKKTESVKHLAGTCALGKVVDGLLKVKGVQGLRIVDASVMPIQVSAHTQATVYGIAERAAELILAGRKWAGL
jgi:choline dehydrogenase-like flavoprotein